MGRGGEATLLSVRVEVLERENESLAAECARLRDELALAEPVSHDSIVEGLFELRAALARALSLVKLDDETRVAWRELADLLKRWGECPLQVVRRES